MDQSNTSTGDNPWSVEPTQRCPSCGYCAHCGRRDAAPYVPYVPYNPYPHYPSPWGGVVPSPYPCITYTTGTTTVGTTMNLKLDS